MTACEYCATKVRAPHTVAFRTGSTSLLLCASCAQTEARKMHDKTRRWWTLLGNCLACGNKVYRSLSVLAASRKSPAGCTCSLRCARIARLDYLKQERHQARKSRLCEVCKKSFVPQRSDAVTCSNACRQSLFRMRHAAQAEPPK